MSYEKQEWETGEVITASKLNHIEDGVDGMNGSYEKQTWSTGEVITAEKLNHIEAGIENGSSGDDSNLVDLIERDITSLDIPNGTYSIGSYVCRDCTSLESVTIPNGVTSIGVNAFYGCSNLDTVNFPSSVTLIDGNAFTNCTSLTSLVMDGVVTIGTNSFKGCSSIESIDLPSSLTSIGMTAFQNCTSLMSITCRATSPPTLNEKSLSGVPADANIYVPAGSVDAYKAASQWSSRASYIQAIPS